MSLRTALPVLFLALAVSLAATGQADRSAVVAGAKSAIDADRPDEALALLDRYLAAHPDDALALAWHGAARLKATMAAAARLRYQNLATLKNEWPKSLADLERAIAIDPKVPDAYFWRGFWYAVDGKDRLAIADYSRAIALDASVANYWCERGAAKQRRADYRGARADYLETLARDPAHENAREWLAGVEERLGLPPTASVAPPTTTTARTPPTPPRPVPEPQPTVVPNVPEALSPTPSADAFDPKGLPPVVDEQRAVVTPAGGSVALANGARIDFPAGALPKAGQVTLRRLASARPDRGLYQVLAPVDRLNAPAVVTLPVASPDGSPVLDVDVYHFHNASDAGTLLDVNWTNGQPTARVEVREFSVLGYTIIYAGLTYIIGSDALNQKMANTPERFAEAAAAAINASSRKSVRLAVPAYSQHSPQTLWCWAASLAGTLQAAMPVAAALADPQKPQVLATTGSYDRQGLLNAGPSSLHWSDNRVVQWVRGKVGSANIVDYLRLKSGATVEGQSFSKYPYLAYYIVKTLDQGYAIALDIRGKTHVVNIVGYDADGPYLQDPFGAPPIPMHTSWSGFFSVINVGGLALTNNYVITTVIKTPLTASDRVLSINAPSCEWNEPSPNVLNRNGVYFSTPTPRMYSGFAWDATAPHGLRLSTGGTVAEPKPDAAGALPVGGQTQIGARNLEVGNTSGNAVAVSIDLALVHPRTNRTIPLLQMSGLSAKPESLTSFDSQADVPLLGKLPKDLKTLESYVLRATLNSAGQSVDRVEMALDIWPFRLDAITPEPMVDGRTRYTFAGTGFRGGRLVLRVGSKNVPNELEVSGVNVLDDEKAEFRSDNPAIDPLKMFPDGWVYLKIRSERGGGNLLTEDLETNRLSPPVTGGQVTVFVGKTFDEMGRPNNPFQTEADPLPNIEVTWSFRRALLPVTGTARTNQMGLVVIKDVPLDAVVTISARGETRTATCTAKDPKPVANFGWEGRTIIIKR